MNIIYDVRIRIIGNEMFYVMMIGNDSLFARKYIDRWT